MYNQQWLDINGKNDLPIYSQPSLKCSALLLFYLGSLSLSPYTIQRICVLNVNFTLKHGWRNHNERKLIIVVLRANGQLVVVCPRTNVVVWFCLLHRKPDIHIKVAINNSMKTLKTTLDGKTDQAAPHWIEVKASHLIKAYFRLSHVQSKHYECDYYVMHWMWNIVNKGLKNEWSMWFGDRTPLDLETITTIHEKWATYFLEVKNIQFRNVEMI
ncbi:hypothetical protein HKD37_07G019392 [Glycine soja]